MSLLLDNKQGIISAGSNSPRLLNSVPTSPVNGDIWLDGTTLKTYSEGSESAVGGLVSAPASPTATGVVGSWASDGTYMYRCTATDTWVRWVVITSW